MDAELISLLPCPEIIAEEWEGGRVVSTTRCGAIIDVIQVYAFGDIPAARIRCRGLQPAVGEAVDAALHARRHVLNGSLDSLWCALDLATAALVDFSADDNRLRNQVVDFRYELAELAERDGDRSVATRYGHQVAYLVDHCVTDEPSGFDTMLLPSDYVCPEQAAATEVSHLRFRLNAAGRAVGEATIATQYADSFEQFMLHCSRGLQASVWDAYFDYWAQPHGLEEELEQLAS